MNRRPRKVLGLVAIGGILALLLVVIARNHVRSDDRVRDTQGTVDTPNSPDKKPSPETVPEKPKDEVPPPRVASIVGSVVLPEPREKLSYSIYVISPQGDLEHQVSLLQIGRNTSSSSAKLGYSTSSLASNHANFPSPFSDNQYTRSLDKRLPRCSFLRCIRPCLFSFLRYEDAPAGVNSR